MTLRLIRGTLHISEMLMSHVGAVTCLGPCSCGSAEMGTFGELLGSDDLHLGLQEIQVSGGWFRGHLRGFLHISVSTYFLFLSLTKLHVLLPAQCLECSFSANEICPRLFGCAHIPFLTTETNHRSFPNSCDATIALGA